MDYYSEEHAFEGVYGRLTNFAGSGDVVVSHSVYLNPAERGKGKGKRAHFQRLKKMQELGYTYALCTVRADNAAERTILRRAGWEVLANYRGYGGAHLILYGRHVGTRGN